MKRLSLLLLTVLFTFFTASAQYNYEKNSSLSEQQINQIIKKIRKAYYAMKNATTDDDAQKTIITFSITSGPQIPVIGNYDINFSYDVQKGFATGKSTRAASQTTYQLFYMPWGLAFVYEQDDYGNQMRIYIYKGKIIKAYTKDTDGQITDGVSLDIDYNRVDKTLQALNSLYQDLCGCSSDEDD